MKSSAILRDGRSTCRAAEAAEWSPIDNRNAGVVDVSEGRSSLPGMRERESAEIVGVPEHVLDELAQALADKLDVLLDRLTDRALTAPDAGTSAWRKQWLDRDSPTGHERQARRRNVRAALASRAGIIFQTPSEQVAPTLIAAVKRRPQPRRRPVDHDQLAIF